MRKLGKLGDVQVFNGFAQFNKCHIWSCAYIIEPINKLMRKAEEFTCSEKCKEA